jgi:hypothetical protein
MSIVALTRVRNQRLARLDELLKERILILDGAMDECAFCGSPL